MSVAADAVPFVTYHLKRVPLDERTVIAQFPNGNTVVYNLERTQMDFLSNLNLDNMITRDRAKREGVVPEKRVFVAPLPAELPDDGAFEYRAVESLASLTQEMKPNTVLCFDLSKDSRLLQIFVEYQDLVGFEPVVMRGLPKTLYDAKFDTEVFNCPSVSYFDIYEAAVRRKEEAISTAKADKSAVGTVARRELQVNNDNGKFSRFDVASTKVNRASVDRETDPDVVSGEGQ